MLYECSFKVGDLVEYRSWYDGDGSWVSIENMVGIILEIITISEDENYAYMPANEVLYDIKVYWFVEETSETIPDILLDHYGSEVSMFK